MKIRTTRCRYCGSRTVIWTQTLAGNWRLCDAKPVPYTAALRGVVLHRSQGWLPADSVHPEPAEMLPHHMCRSKRTAPDIPTIGGIVDDWVGFHRPLNPTPTPARKRDKRAS